MSPVSPGTVTHHGWVWPLISGNVIYLIFLLTCLVPNYLHSHAPWSDVAERTRDLLSSWLALGASALTISEVLAMHYAYGPLVSMRPGNAILAGVAVASLLGPFYKWFARILWQRGAKQVFTLSRWRNTVAEVASDVKSLVHMKHAETCSFCREIEQKHSELCDECHELEGKHVASCEAVSAVATGTGWPK